MGCNCYKPKLKNRAEDFIVELLWHLQLKNHNFNSLIKLFEILDIEVKDSLLHYNLKLPQQKSFSKKRLSKIYSIKENKPTSSIQSLNRILKNALIGSQKDNAHIKLVSFMNLKYVSENAEVESKDLSNISEDDSKSNITNEENNNSNAHKRVYSNFSEMFHQKLNSVGDSFLNQEKEDQEDKENNDAFEKSPEKEECINKTNLLKENEKEDKKNDDDDEIFYSPVSFRKIVNNNKIDIDESNKKNSFPQLFINKYNIQIKNNENSLLQPLSQNSNGISKNNHNSYRSKSSITSLPSIDYCTKVKNVNISINNIIKSILYNNLINERSIEISYQLLFLPLNETYTIDNYKLLVLSWSFGFLKSNKNDTKAEPKHLLFFKCLQIIYGSIVYMNNIHEFLKLYIYYSTKWINKLALEFAYNNKGKEVNGVIVDLDLLLHLENLNDSVFSNKRLSKISNYICDLIQITNGKDYFYIKSKFNKGSSHNLLSMNDFSFTNNMLNNDSILAYDSINGNSQSIINSGRTNIVNGMNKNTKNKNSKDELFTGISITDCSLLDCLFDAYYLRDYIISTFVCE